MRVEQLENRCLLSCLATQHGSLLTVDAGGDYVGIGETDAGDVEVVCLAPDSVDVTLEDSFSNVRRIAVHGGPEDDWINVFLAGQINLRVDINTFDGFDTVEISAVEIAAPLSLRVNLGNDDDWFSFEVQGDVLDSMRINVLAGNGDDYVEMTTYSQIVDGRNTISVSLGAGDDEADIAIDVADGSRPPSVRLSGGSGADALYVDQVLMERGRVRASQFEDVIVMPSCALDDPDCQL